MPTGEYHAALMYSHLQVSLGRVPMLQTTGTVSRTVLPVVVVGAQERLRDADFWKNTPEAFLGLLY